MFGYKGMLNRYSYLKPYNGLHREMTDFGIKEHNEKAIKLTNGLDPMKYESISVSPLEFIDCNVAEGFPNA